MKTFFSKSLEIAEGKGLRFLESHVSQHGASKSSMSFVCEDAIVV